MEEITPQVMFYIFNIPVRDTVVSTWIMMGILTILILVLRRFSPTSIEMVIEFLNDFISDLMGRPVATYLPLLGSLAIFIAVGNLLGVIPFLNAPTRDINTTFALALVVFFSVHYFGVKEEGFVTYFKNLASPIFLLPLEIISQLSRTLSLTLRLFGNILSGELIVAIILSLVPLFVPLPLIGLSIFTGLLQAYIFTALAAVYITAGMESSKPNSNK